MLKHRKDAERVPAGFLLFGQYFDAVFLYQYHVLDLCGKTVIDRIDCPVVILVHKKVRTAFVDHRLDGKHHTRNKEHLTSLWCNVTYERIFVKFKSDPVTTDLFYNGITIGLCVRIDGIGNVAQMSPWLCGCKSLLDALFRNTYKTLGTLRDISHLEHPGCI